MAKLSHVIILFMVAMSSTVGAYDVLLGAYYGLRGYNLPPPSKVVQLCKKYNIQRVRLDEPNLDVLEAFRGMGIDISFGVSNSLIIDMATNPNLVEEWFVTYIAPFIGDFTINYIIVGDKAIPGLHEWILPVMKSLQDLLNAHSLEQIKLTTLVASSALSIKTPPSSGAFESTSAANMRDILHFLWEQGSPLMLSLYPYRRYVYDGNRTLGYATFTEENLLFHDGDLIYNNLFDEMVDAFYAAIDKQEIGDVAIAVAETGWPTCGYYNATTSTIAATYNRNFKSHITSGKGTPKKSNIYIEGFIQSIFNENEEPEGDSQCYGMFNVDSTPIYSPVF